MIWPHARTSCHQELPPDGKDKCALRLTLSVVADRLASRICFAVSWNLPCSTAMLITRIDGMVSYAFGRCRLSKTRAPTAYQTAPALIIPLRGLSHDANA